MSTMSITPNAPIPSATHILLTHIPPFLRHPRNLRDLLITTGIIKHVAYTCPIKRHSSAEKSKDDENQDVAAVVKLNHVSQAMTFIRNWEKAKDELKSPMRSFLWYEDGTMPALYPEKSDVDRRMLESLWDALYNKRSDDDVGRIAMAADDSFVQKFVETYRSIEVTQEQLDKGLITIENGSYTHITQQVHDDKKLDRAKVAAAAGGAYDDEADPLNAPEVLEAVAQFRKKLEETQGGYKKKRAEYVNKRLEVEVKKAKEKIIQRKKEAEEMSKMPPLVPPPTAVPIPGPGPGGLPPPPLPLGALPPPMLPNTIPSLPPPLGGMVPPPLPINIPPQPGGVPMPESIPTMSSDSSLSKKRPADTTTDHHDGETNKKIKTAEDNSTRKLRIDVQADNASSIAEIRARNEAADRAVAYLQEAKSFNKEDLLSNTKHFPLLDNENVPEIRKFVKEQIVEYLGEEEATLIDFVMNYLKKEHDKDRITNGLLDEMKMVLEEDSVTFVVDLFQRVVDLSIKTQKEE